MKTSIKTIITTSVLALAAGHVVAMNGGTVVPVDQIQATTGAVYIANAAPTHCSGTLLAPTWVLTARHCVLPRAFGFGLGGDTTSAPASRTASANTAMRTATGRIVLGGWVADKGHGDLKTRRAAVMALTPDGHLETAFGPEAIATISLPDPSVTSSEVSHVMQLGTTSDLVAVGRVATSAGDQMLIAHLNVNGQLVGAPWPVTSSGMQIPVAGSAVRAAAAGTNIVVAGTVVAGGLPHWSAIKLDSSGHTVAFSPSFGTVTAGVLLDVVTVGNHLVWMGTLHDRGPNPVIQTTDFNGVAEGPMVTIDALAVPIPSRLRAHGLDSVWIAGTNNARTTARVARYSIPAAMPSAGWPAGGVETTPSPDLNAHIEVNDLGEDAAGNVIVVGAWLVANDPHALIARFTSSGTRDLSYGQSGMVVTLDHDVQRANAVVVTGSATAPYVLIGRQGEGSDDAMWAGGFTDRSDVSAGMSVQYANAASAVKKIVMHPDPLVDSALIELNVALTDQAGIKITGIEDLPVQSLEGEQIKCFGYGLNESETTGQLKVGLFTIDGTDDIDISLLGKAPTMIRGGDSGGGCVIEHDGGTYVVGTVKMSVESEIALSGSSEKSTLAWLVDHSLFGDFVAQNVPGYAH